ncbi:helix-turn-helix transcriptional regulator [Clostridium tyrobutyricum]|uniref:helix-turn-helix transcriptional regulator n=1 Tax=Clostridium tyrobutyricum TaxID=1519 RepID=UPI001C38B223|nr:helix-turn-helix transcriptional regulator [Clostridium tyrobutyricum]MBV4426484.1 helix-turn-helix domain-containing protein [Clostridium tyrobutyricum]MBV4436719.1 helix-turn-helix domain-containing protein [Clostridium tyrobutyricum]
MNSKLIEFRESLNMSQKDMAATLGISSSFYTKIELGQRNPSFNFIKKMKKRFNVNVDEIFFRNQLHKTCINKQKEVV